MIGNETENQRPRRIEVVEVMTLSDEPDGPALRLSPRGAAWLVDAAVLLAAASSAHAPRAGELMARRSSDARSSS